MCGVTRRIFIRSFIYGKITDYCVLENNTDWNEVIGNRQWFIMIDGVAVYIKAITGEFVQMVFPLDGVITEPPK